MSVARAQSEISSSEFAEWMAYEEIDPGDPERSDLRTALICSVIANVFAGKGSRPIPIKDFMLSFDEQASRGATPEEVKIKLKTFLSSLKSRKKVSRKKVSGK